MRVSSKNLLGYSMDIKQMGVGITLGSRHEVFNFRDIQSITSLVGALFVCGEVQSPVRVAVVLIAVNMFTSNLSVNQKKSQTGRDQGMSWMFYIS